MKNKKLLWLTAFIPLVLLALLFFSKTDFALDLKLVSEMLHSGNTSSLQMFYYDGGKVSWLVSIIITIYATVVPMYSKSTVIIANQSYFGDVLGGILVATGMILAVIYVLVLIFSVAKIFGFRSKPAN